MNLSKQDLALIVIALQDFELEAGRDPRLVRRAQRLQATMLLAHETLIRREHRAADLDAPENALAHQIDALKGDA